MAHVPGGGRSANTIPPLVFVSVAVLASGNAVAIRFSNRELDWLWGASLRFGLAAAVLVVLMVTLRLPWPRGKELQGALAFGALALGAAFALTYWALQSIQAGLAQTLLSLTPLATLLLAGVAGLERITRVALLGAIIATVGVAAVAWRPDGGNQPVLPILAMVAAVVCVALGTLLVRRSRSVHPIAMNAVAALTAGALLTSGSLVTGQLPTLPTTSQTWGAVIYLAVVGSVVVFSLQLLLLQHWSASRANYVFVLIPLLTIAISSQLDDERVGPGLAVGGTLIVLGVYLGALRGHWHDSAGVRRAREK